MDVQATAEAAPLPPVSFPPLSPAPTPAPDPTPTPSVGGVAASNTSGSSANGNSAVSTQAPPSQPNTVPSLPPAPTGVANSALGQEVAKLFNTASENVSVSFQVAPGSNEVVVVFTDKTSGKTIIQFPSETLIALAQFFNKLAGSVLDKKA